MAFGAEGNAMEAEVGQFARRELYHGVRILFCDCLIFIQIFAFGVWFW